MQKKKKYRKNMYVFIILQKSEGGKSKNNI